ncbi:MAG: DUF2322 family protein [Pseudomonadota bacterium]
MNNFADNLKTLPAIDNIEKLELYDGNTLVDTIENKPGKAGSVSVYNALNQEFGSLNSAAAEKGIALYAEHTADAEANPGKHPNIDRLLEVIAKQSELRIHTITH